MATHRQRHAGKCSGARDGKTDSRGEDVDADARERRAAGRVSQMKAAAEQSAPRANEPPRDKLPENAQRMRTWALARWQHVAAAVNPFDIEELAALRAERTKSPHQLGDMPLIVLTRALRGRDRAGQ